jgi:hypothetical protein
MVSQIFVSFYRCGELFYRVRLCTQFSIEFQSSQMIERMKYKPIWSVLFLLRGYKCRPVTATAVVSEFDVNY